MGVKKLDLSPLERAVRVPVKTQMKDAVARLGGAGKAYLAKPVRLWERKPSFHYRSRFTTVQSGKRKVLKYSITFSVRERGLPVWRWVNYGTRPHAIRPRGDYPLKLRYYPPLTSPLHPESSSYTERGEAWFYRVSRARIVHAQSIRPRKWDHHLVLYLRKMVREEFNKLRRYFAKDPFRVARPRTREG